MSILESKLMKWTDLFDIFEGSVALNPQMEDSIRNLFPNFTDEQMRALNWYIRNRNKGLSMFVKGTSYDVVNSYSYTFQAFVYSNAQRLKFALLTEVDGLKKTREYTYTEKADGLKNYDKQDGTVTSDRDTTGTSKGGYYTDSDEYISDTPKYENHTDHNGTTTTNNTRNKFIDIEKTENETIVDPYSYVHINDFINGFKRFTSIIDEYYDEWTCPLR